MGSECTSPVPVTDFIPEVNTRLLASQTGFPVRFPLVSVLCLNAWNSTCQLRPVSVATGPVTCAVSRACCPSVAEDAAVVVIPGGVTVVSVPGRFGPAVGVGVPDDVGEGFYPVVHTRRGEDYRVAVVFDPVHEAGCDTDRGTGVNQVGSLTYRGWCPG